jgi:acyl carrier protein
MRDTGLVRARDLVAAVQQVVCEVTRYPQHLVTPDGHLEDDLGIDSVKLTEIFAALRVRYGVAERLTSNVRELRTINEIAERLAQALPAAPAKINGTAVAHAAVDLTGELVRIVAEVTRYPEHLIGPDDDFEDTLGIDSVKRAEILAVARERLHLPAFDKATVGSLRDVRRLAAAIAGLGVNAPAAEPAPTPVPALAPAPDRPFAGRTVVVAGPARRIAAHLAALGAQVVVHGEAAAPAEIDGVVGVVGPGPAAEAGLAVHRLAVEAAPALRRRGGGRCVVVGGADATGLEALVRYLAVALAPDGVRVNGIAAGADEHDVALVVELLLGDRAASINASVVNVGPSLRADAPGTFAPP